MTMMKTIEKSFSFVPALSVSGSSAVSIYSAIISIIASVMIIPPPGKVF